jgi:hypothetical protein
MLRRLWKSLILSQNGNGGLGSRDGISIFSKPKAMKENDKKHVGHLLGISHSASEMLGEAGLQHNL